MLADTNGYGSAKTFEINISDRVEQQQVLPQDVVFLPPRRYENAMLRKTDIEVAVLFGMEGVQNDIFSRYLYIAGTRARTLLYVVGDESFWNRVNGSLKEGEEPYADEIIQKHQNP